VLLSVQVARPGRCAGTYVVLAAASASNFGEKLTHTDGLYFTVTAFTAVGFGDITAKSEGHGS
jgi:voltage-gated potassium channel